jgi:hypothetical protein
MGERNACDEETYQSVKFVFRASFEALYLLGAQKSPLQGGAGDESTRAEPLTSGFS